VLGLCERFGCLPEQLYDADTELLRLVAIEQRGRPPEQADDGYGQMPPGM